MIRLQKRFQLALGALALFLTGCSGAALPAATVAAPASTLPPPAVQFVTPAYTQGRAAVRSAENPPAGEALPAAVVTLSLTETPSDSPAGAQTETGPPQRTSTQAAEIPYPSEHYITGIHGHKQFFSLGCEAAVAKDWAAFFGVEINEFHFQYELPLSDNPDKGFVGSVDGPWGQTPPYAYGVHAGPVADLLRRYGLPASAHRGLTIEQIKAELAEDDPVIAWVIGRVVGGVPAEYTDKEGDTVIVAAYEHVVLVTGYSEETLRVNSNGVFYDFPIEVFENSWSVLGNMAILYE